MAAEIGQYPHCHVTRNRDASMRPRRMAAEIIGTPAEGKSNVKGLQ